MEHDSIAAIITAYLRLYPDEAAALEPLAAQLAHMPPDEPRALFSRGTLPGHITASGIAIHGGRMLMVFHLYLRRWLQPGGHVEAGETPLQAAQRELLEETGLRAAARIWRGGKGLSEAVPLDIDIHQIPANPKKGEPAHFHYDFRYLLEPAGEARQAGELSYAWRDFAEIREANLRRVIDKLNLRKPD